VCDKWQVIGLVYNKAIKTLINLFHGVSYFDYVMVFICGSSFMAAQISVHVVIHALYISSLELPIRGMFFRKLSSSF